MCCPWNSSDFSVSFPGSTTSSCLLFVFPGIFYLKISNGPLRSFDSIGVTIQIYEILLNQATKTFLFTDYNSYIWFFFSVFLIWCSLLFMLFVSPGYGSGGVWSDYGTHQLLCHCHYMGTGHLSLSGPSLPKFSARAYTGKSVPKNLNTGSDKC